MSEAITRTGVVSSDNGPGCAGSGAPDWGETSAVAVWSVGAVAAAETPEVGSVELPSEFACNKMADVILGQK